MAHKFDPSRKGKLEGEAREALYDVHRLIHWFGISRGMIVADVGCGTGYCTVPIAARVGERGMVFACDISEEMLDEVREKISRWQIGNVVTVLSAENGIPLDDETVDFVHLSLLLHELEEPGTFLAELKRILKPGGEVGIVDWEKVDSPSGPPQEERIALAEAKRILEQSGLAVVRETMPGAYHYALVAARPEDLFRKKVERVAEKLVEELLCLSERAMRGAVLAERFSAVKAETVVEILHEFCVRAAEKRPQYVDVLENCLDMDRLKAVVGLEKMSSIYLLAKARGYNDVVRLLMNPPPKGKAYSEYDFVEGQDQGDITLGEKRSLAKGFDKDRLDKIIYDEDPLVVRHLPNNPRLTERDVLKIVSKRPTRPEVLKVIFESEKWVSRYVIKRALVLNPYTPTGIALGLVNLMQYKDLRLIASSGSLHDELRASARELLEKNY